MEFLRLLEAARTPALTAFMAAITYLGDETVFMVLAITVFWCVSKRQGYYVFAVGLGGTVVKMIFPIELEGFGARAGILKDYDVASLVKYPGK